MKNIETLHGLYVQRKFGLSTWKNYVDWAVSCLVNQQDNDDNNIILLASATDEREATELTAKILETWLPNHQIDEHYWAGQYIVELHNQFTHGELSIVALDKLFDRINEKLNNPDWLIMLSRNCEYSTDIPNFVQLFYDEFNYIVNLWKGCRDYTEFALKYDRSVSDSHNIRLNKHT